MRFTPVRAARLAAAVAAGVGLVVALVVVLVARAGDHAAIRRLRQRNLVLAPDLQRPAGRVLREHVGLPAIVAIPDHVVSVRAMMTSKLRTTPTNQPAKAKSTGRRGHRRPYHQAVRMVRVVRRQLDARARPHRQRNTLARDRGVCDGDAFRVSETDSAANRESITILQRGPSIFEMSTGSVHVSPPAPTAVSQRAPTSSMMRARDAMAEIRSVVSQWAPTSMREMRIIDDAYRPGW